MIPKIIYYNWTGSDPIPSNCQKYIDNWKLIMPDYEIIKITLAQDRDYPFVRKAIEHKKSIFATGYLKLRQIYETGGISMDVDMEIIRSLDGLLGEKFFASCEKPWRINWSVMGTEANHFILKDYLEFLDNVDWGAAYPQGIDIDLTVQHYTDYAKLHGWQERDETQRLDGFTIFNSKYFYPYYFNQICSPECITPETYGIHHWTALWQTFAQ
jgi:hypothetical protein